MNYYLNRINKNKLSELILSTISGQKGFTLIELMLVIVIVGILSGIIIGIVNPVKMQARAKDATVKAVMNKVALVAGAFVSAQGIVPSGSEIIQELNGATVVSGCASGSTSCIFNITNSQLGTLCTGASSWNGAQSGGTQCYYYYCAGASANASDACSALAAAGGNFRIAAKSWSNDVVYMYNSSTSRFYSCNASGGACALIP